jgi:hypothetical protein
MGLTRDIIAYCIMPLLGLFKPFMAFTVKVFFKISGIFVQLHKSQNCGPKVENCGFIKAHISNMH